MRIGNLALDTPLILAPMAGICDLPLRLLCRELGGVGMACTNLLNCNAIVRGIDPVRKHARPYPTDRPLCVQLYGNANDPLPEAARWIEEQGADVIDINMGCPVDKIAKKRGGALLLRDPASTADLASRVVECVDVPVTAKIRLGWETDEIVAADLARRLEDAGIAAITVHGRTAEQKFRGTVDMEGVAAVAAAVAVPVIGNGDIRSANDAMYMLATTGCDGLMIGRAATAEPWIFHQIADALAGREPTELTLEHKLTVVERHLDLILEHRGEQAAVRCLRSRISRYGRTMGHVKPLKDAIRKAGSSMEIRNALRQWISRPQQLATC
jgi:nifR3 family TIM-barrel protein